ncbi:MAG TPA: hypothetical protein VGK29_23565, partial [Paludibaculum sp.]
ILDSRPIHPTKVYWPTRITDEAGRASYVVSLQHWSSRVSRVLDSSEVKPTSPAGWHEETLATGCLGMDVHLFPHTVLTPADDRCADCKTILWRINKNAN